MEIHFSKYHGAGNDFVIIDDRNEIISKLEKTRLHEWVKSVCHRNFGVGADGLMLLKRHNSTDFSMTYFNSDGKEGSMCGNGGRCIAAFAHHKNIAAANMQFMAVDGLHHAEIINLAPGQTHIRLKMKDVSFNGAFSDPLTLDTGSPHYVTFVTNLENMDVVFLGRNIRNSIPYRENGINVNFAEIFSNHIYLRTYERGVENETLACGTGATATALAAFLKGVTIKNQAVNIVTPGGWLKVSFEHSAQENLFTNVWLEGPAEKVFEGVLPFSL